jgi:hypothetical protein
MFKFGAARAKWPLLMIIVMIVALFAPDVASATQLTQAGVRLGRLGISASTANDLLVTFKLNTTPTSVAKITVTFPAGFTIATGTPTVSTSGFPNTPASITAPPGSLTAAATAASRTIVVSGLTSASLNGTTLYGFIIPTGTITNPASSGQYNVTVESDNSGSSTIDLTTTQVDIVGASANQDQVVVSASVAPNFSFSLSANTDTIPKVDPTTIQTSTGVTMTVGTNSPLGYTAYVKSANAALTSATNPGTPITTGTFNGSPDSLSAGTTDYGFVPTTAGPACSSCTGTITYDGEYAVSDGTHAGSFNGAGGFASFVSRNGYTNADKVLLQERIAVSPTIGYANDYTDTLTVVAAGNF